MPVAVSLHAATLAQDHELLVFLSDTAAVNGVEPSRLIVDVLGPPPIGHTTSFRNAIDGLKAIGDSDRDGRRGSREGRNESGRDQRHQRSEDKVAGNVRHSEISQGMGSTPT